ncbi:MAG TPA: alkaline phosphatase family protein [Hyphomicrobiales bacterium]|nr:alkaline phosphatase family protein [Hyphomicrobiales bacterium]
MGKVRNILFVMADQLRWDHLSCYGHPHLKTPAIDGLAARGVRFDRAYVNATVCGPSRMSYYTGRSMASHGSTWNGVPLRIGEPTLGDHLRPLGMRVALVGKTHMAADRAGMARLGIAPGSIEGVYASECGFEPYVRDDGLHPDGLVDPDLAYNAWLRARGYNDTNPWNSRANAGLGPGGEVLSAWSMRNAPLAANIAEEHSETAYMTGRAIDFIRDAGDQPWLCHLSYIKPHWPYIAPAPYHDMFGPGDMLPVNRSEGERANPHPVYAAYMRHPESESFSREEVRRAVVPVYMGLIRQIDDHLGRLFRFMEERGLFENTMVVVTSDHGDYLGDHWLGEKELFHEPSVRVPLVVYDPDPAADATRGTASGAFVEAIDLAATFVASQDGPDLSHILEGRSLLPLLRGGAAPEGWRDMVVSELDYSFRRARTDIGMPAGRCRAWMVRTAQWKFVYYEGLPPQLFDLVDDPKELDDRGTDPALAEVRGEMEARLFAWLRARKARITMTDAAIENRSGRHPRGIIIGDW